MEPIIKSVKRRTAYPTDCYWAIAKMSYDGRKIHLTYDIVGKRLVVHQGHHLNEEELNKLTTYANGFFESLLKKENRASA